MFVVVMHERIRDRSKPESRNRFPLTRQGGDRSLPAPFPMDIVEARRETHLSTPQSQTQEGPRLPGPHAVPPWPARPEAASGQRKSAAHRLTGRLRPTERLRKRSDFDRVFRTRQAVAGPCLVLHLCRDAALERAFGLVIGRKVGNAVVRNRVRRRLREIYRLNRDRLPERGVHLVLVVRPGAAAATYRGLEEEVLALWARAGLCSVADGSNAAGRGRERMPGKE